MALGSAPITPLIAPIHPWSKSKLAFCLAASFALVSLVAVLVALAHTALPISRIERRSKSLGQILTWPYIGDTYDTDAV